MAPPRPTVALDRPIRSPRRIYLAAGYSWLFAASMLAMGPLAAVTSREGVATALVAVVFFWGLAAAAIWFGRRVRLAELRISSQSVVVRNPIHSHVVPLDAVEAFRPGNVTPHARNGTAGIVLCLKRGNVVPVWALAEEGTIFSMKKKTMGFTPLAGELNALLTSLRQSVGASIPV